MGDFWVDVNNMALRTFLEDIAKFNKDCIQKRMISVEIVTNYRDAVSNLMFDESVRSLIRSGGMSPEKLIVIVLDERYTNINLLKKIKEKKKK